MASLTEKSRSLRAQQRDRSLRPRSSLSTKRLRFLSPGAAVRNWPSCQGNRKKYHRRARRRVLTSPTSNASFG